jgi:hypothetical protein
MHDPRLDPRPDQLSHYTDLPTFNAIVENKELWCTGIRHMNDSSESHRLLKWVLTAANNELSGRHAKSWQCFLDGFPKTEEEMDNHLIGRCMSLHSVRNKMT